MSEKAWPYPSNDEPLMLPSGGTVRFYDLILLRRLTELAFSVHYRSELERKNGAARRAEAEEVIRHFEAASSCRDARRANASICATPAQAATKEPPEEIFRFERENDGNWRFIGKAELPPHTA